MSQPNDIAPNGPTYVDIKPEFQEGVRIYEVYKSKNTSTIFFVILKFPDK